MKKNLFSKLIGILLLCTTLVSCKQQNYNAVDRLAMNEQEQFKYNIARYIADLPKYANDQNKFEERFDNIYQALAKNIQLKQYYESEDGAIYFEVWKRAPSLLVKYNATGGMLKKDKATGKITHYSEIYRTWKMEAEDLAKNTAVIFPKMVDGKNLSGYYTENANGKLIIEFPDKLVSYNDSLRKWMMRSSIN